MKVKPASGAAIDEGSAGARASLASEGIVRGEEESEKGADSLVATENTARGGENRSRACCTCRLMSL
ncbi:hypothetical protein L484_021603 [Morus notabilis]|uniref:Uncharacterized protein n=1 Tax=Morus notabilis TaxID=981085 RepID=W9SM67_9ROSA|nr:hypothetical protein L484_021603 [Morus notabilis]